MVQIAANPLQANPLMTANGDVKITLRRTAKKAFRFSGRCLVESTGYRRAAAHWYEVGVFERYVGGFVASVRHFYKSDEERDHYCAERFDHLEEAITFLESYRPQDDVPVRFDPNCARLSAAEVAVHAATLRAQHAEYKRSYETVCTDVLHALTA